MQRREFMTSIAAATAALGILPRAASAASKAIETLRADLEGSQEFWPRIREEFMLKPGLAHLNCGSLGSCPRLVVDSVAQFMRELEEDPVHQNWGPLGGAAEFVRAHAAEFIGGAPEEVTITRNTTMGMNAIASGIRLKSGDEILTTTHEHAGGSTCWRHRAKSDGVKIVQIKMPVPLKNTTEFLKLVAQHITPRTRVCSFCHVDTFTGMHLPIRDIGNLIKDRDILLICDGAQGPGMLDVDVKRLGVDAYASSSHKWILAPKGSGLLYIRKEAQDRIRPMELQSGYGIYTGSTGTRSIPQILGHGLAIDFHNFIGRDRVEARCRSLRELARTRLEDVEWLESISPAEEDLQSGMVSFRLRRGSSQNLADALREKHSIVVKPLPRTIALTPGTPVEDYNAIRISTHVFNGEEEIERLGNALERI